MKKVRKSLVLDNWEKEEPGPQLLTEDIPDTQVCKAFLKIMVAVSSSAFCFLVIVFYSLERHIKFPLVLFRKKHVTVENISFYFLAFYMFLF